MDSSLEYRRQTAIRLQLARLAQALQGADTLQLTQVLGEAEISAAEAAAARRSGCRSNAWAVAELRRRRGRAGAPVDLPLDGFVLEVRDLSLLATGSALARLRIWDVTGPRRRFAEFTMDFDANGDGLLPVRAQGLMSGLCGLALAP